MTGQVRVTFFAGLATLLAAMSLTPIFEGAAWFWPSIGVLLLVGGSGALLRRRPVAAGLVPAVQAGIALLWLTWLYAENAAGGLLPGPGAFRDFTDLISTGADDAALYSPPVPDSRGLEFMTVLGITAVAIVVDALAVTFRHAALAGLPLLALYTVPASVLSGGLNAIYFILAAIGYIGLLIAEGRDKVSRWGRPLIASASIGRGTARAVAPVETSTFAQVGRRIGAAVIGLAVVVPAALPLTESAMFRGGDGLFGGGGDGDGDDATVIDPVVSLRRDFFDRDERTVMFVDTDDPGAAGTYYRMATLGEFDGEEWRRSEPATEDVNPDTLRTPIGLAEDVPRTEVHSRVETTESLESDHLPVQYPLTGLEIDGSWLVDLPTGNILSARGARQLAEIEYGTTSLSLSPDPEQLAAAGTAAEDYGYYLALPGDLPPMVRELAQEVTAGSKSAWDRALRLQAWFTDPQNFTYDTSSNHDGWGSTAIEQFLTGRRGYCEQFAATMAVMARLVNIPSRVNIGFTAGERLEDGRYEITTKDLHAWPELYFEGIGWLRFEPTPISAQEGRGSTPAYAQAATQDEALPDDGADTGSAGPTSTTQPSTGPSPEAIPDAASCSGLPPQQLRECLDIVRSQSTPVQPADDPLLPPWALAGGALVLLGLLTPASLRLAIRRRRYRAAGRQPAAVANAAWSELRDSAVDLGYGWPSSETPRQSAARLTKEAKLRKRHIEALSRLTSAIERARYAPTVAPLPGAAKQVRTVREGLAARVGRSRRFRARALPASTVTVAHWAGERFADLLDWIDRLGSSLRTRFGMKGTLSR